MKLEECAVVADDWISKSSGYKDNIASRYNKLDEDGDWVITFWWNNRSIYLHWSPTSARFHTLVAYKDMDSDKISITAECPDLIKLKAEKRLKLCSWTGQTGNTAARSD